MPMLLNVPIVTIHLCTACVLFPDCCSVISCFFTSLTKLFSDKSLPFFVHSSSAAVAAAFTAETCLQMMTWSQLFARLINIFSVHTNTVCAIISVPSSHKHIFELLFREKWVRRVENARLTVCLFVCCCC